MICHQQTLRADLQPSPRGEEMSETACRMSPKGASSPSSMPAYLSAAQPRTCNPNIFLHTCQEVEYFVQGRPFTNIFLMACRLPYLQVAKIRVMQEIGFRLVQDTPLGPPRGFWSALLKWTLCSKIIRDNWRSAVLVQLPQGQALQQKVARFPFFFFLPSCNALSCLQAGWGLRTAVAESMMSHNLAGLPRTALISRPACLCKDMDLKSPWADKKGPSDAF